MKDLDFSRIMEKLMEGQDLSDDESVFAMRDVVNSKFTNAQSASFLAALRLKPESVGEIAAFAGFLRELSPSVNCDKTGLIDTAGTGGTGISTFNVSTCAAFVAAGCGVKVAKHGNRSSSGIGSADVLEELGVNINAGPELAQRQIESIGVAFLFARLFHRSLGNLALLRKELGFKTVFNLLGPLLNPARPARQLIGVYSGHLLEKMALAASRLGAEKVMAVSGDTDEISMSVETKVCEISGGRASAYTITPEGFGFSRGILKSIQVGNRAQSAAMLISVLKGSDGPARDIVLINAGAATYVSGVAGSISQGISLAEKSIGSGRAMEKLQLLRDFNGHP